MNFFGVTVWFQTMDNACQKQFMKFVGVKFFVVRFLIKYVIQCHKSNLIKSN